MCHSFQICHQGDGLRGSAAQPTALTSRKPSTKSTGTLGAPALLDHCVRESLPAGSPCLLGASPGCGRRGRFHSGHSRFCPIPPPCLSVGTRKQMHWTDPVRVSLPMVRIPVSAPTGRAERHRQAPQVSRENRREGAEGTGASPQGNSCSSSHHRHVAPGSLPALTQEAVSPL